MKYQRSEMRPVDGRTNGSIRCLPQHFHIQLCLSKLRLKAIFYQSILMFDHAQLFPHLMVDHRQNLNPSDLSKSRTFSSFLCIAFFLGLLLNIRPLNRLTQTKQPTTSHSPSGSESHQKFHKNISSLNSTNRGPTKAHILFGTCDIQVKS